MDIRQVSAEEKKKYIAKVKDVFSEMKEMLDTLEIDMESNDLIVQAAAVWISGNLCVWYNDFRTQIKNIEKQKDEIQGEIKDSTAEVH